MSETPKRRRRALVTGGAGFLGSHLVDRLLADGWAVLVIDDLSSGILEQVAPEARFEKLDVSNDPVDWTFREWSAQVVFHLAAQASVPKSMADPIRDLTVNVVGTHRVAEATRLAGGGRFVFVSSGGAIYGETARPATERHAVAPTSFYGIHKLAAEGHVLLSGLSAAIARPSNVYGPRQTAGLEGAVVASFLEQASRGDTLTVHGDGRQTRDFVHVEDVVDALCRLGRADAPTGLWNVATGGAVSVLDLAGFVEVAVGRPLARIHTPRRPGDIARSAMSSRRLRGLGWRPTVRLSEGIATMAGERPLRAGSSDTSPTMRR